MEKDYTPTPAKYSGKAISFHNEDQPDLPGIPPASSPIQDPGCAKKPAKKPGRKPKSPVHPGTEMRPSAAQIPKIDFAALRLSVNYGENLGVKKVLLRVPVGKPDKIEFFRAHADEAMRYPTTIYEDKKNFETYLVTPQMVGMMRGLTRQVVICACIDRRNNPFLVPVQLPNEDGIRNSWHESLAKGLVLAEENWIRLQSNKTNNCYDVLEAEKRLPEPNWPSQTLHDLLAIGFRNRIIDHPDHPIIRKLRGAE